MIQSQHSVLQWLYCVSKWKFLTWTVMISQARSMCRETYSTQRVTKMREDSFQDESFRKWRWWYHKLAALMGWRSWPREPQRRGQRWFRRGQRWFRNEGKDDSTNVLEVGGDEIIGLQYGQDDVHEPESDEEDGEEPLSCSRPSQFRLAKEAGITTNQEDADDHHGADRVQHHGEAQGACWYFKRFALKSKTKIQPHIILMRRNIVTVSKAASPKLWRDGVECKMGFTKHLNVYTVFYGL